MTIRFSKLYTIGHNAKSNSDNFNAEMDNVYSALNTVDTDRTATQTQLDSHNHDTRYYLQGQTYDAATIDAKVSGMANKYIEEVFTIVNANNGAGGFTYTDGTSTYTGVVTAEGYQTFTMQKGAYTMGNNLIECFVNDTIRRSVMSGGLREDATNKITLTLPVGANTELTFRYPTQMLVSGGSALPVMSSVAPTPTGVGFLWVDTSS